MARICLPLWFVTDRSEKATPANPPCGDPRATAAFTTTERLVAFLKGSSAGKWKVELVSDHQDLMLVIADLHSEGASAVCVDPHQDGTGGEHVKLGRIFDEAAAA